MSDLVKLPGGMEARLKDFRYVSPSQIDTYDGENGCPRKWWLSKRLAYIIEGKEVQLPEQDKSYLHFGNAFHAVAERYLLADDQGAAADGKPVDLYPDGWDAKLTPDKWGRPREEQAQLLRELVEESEAKGFLDRRPGREVELSLKDMPVGLTKVRLWAYVDSCVVPGLIQDWKTPTTTRYRLTEERILTNTQAIIYSDALQALGRQRGIPLGEGTEFQFVYATKDPKVAKGKRVTKRSALMTPEHLEWQMQRITAIIERMKVTALCEHIWTVPAPLNSENMIDNERACSAYGGCPFLAICTKSETFPAFFKRIERLNRESDRINDSKRLTQETTQGDKKVSGLFNHLVGKSGTSPAQQAEAAKANAAADATAAAPETLNIRPPWAKHVDHGAPSNCIACGGSGYASNGDPCRGCNTWAQTARNLAVHMFALQGKQWTLKAEFESHWQEAYGPKSNVPVAAEAPPVQTTEADAALDGLLGGSESPQETSEAPTSEQPTETPPSSGAPVAPVVEPEKPEAAPAATPAAAPAAPAAGKPAATPTTKKRAGRKPEGFKLLIGCVGLKLPKAAPVIFITDVLNNIVAPKVAAALHVENYYQISFFDRRDWVNKIEEQIVEELGKSWVVVNVRGQDINHVVGILQPRADLVIQGVMA